VRRASDDNGGRVERVLAAGVGCIRRAEWRGTCTCRVAVALCTAATSSAHQDLRTSSRGPYAQVVYHCDLGDCHSSWQKKATKKTERRCQTERRVSHTRRRMLHDPHGVSSLIGRVWWLRWSMRRSQTCFETRLQLRLQQTFERIGNQRIRYTIIIDQGT
jgi:hypothetical protein